PAPAAADAPPSLADLLEPGGDLGGFGSERAAPPAATQPSNGSNGASGASEAMTSREIAMSVEGPGDMDLPSQQAPPKKQKKRPTLSSDDGLMALMAAGGNTGQVPAVQEGSGVRKRPSGMFSSTMRFFVEGLDEEDEMALVDGPPRTVKPTVIGWVVILAIVLGAVAFVVYKKTSLFGGSAPGSGDEAKLDPNKKGSGSGSATKAAPKVKRGSIALVSAPDGAYFFLHLGDSPVTTKVDSGQNIVVRAERGSYGTVHKTVTAAELASGKAVVKLVLTPAAAAAAATAKNAHVLPPELPAAGTKTGKLVDLKIETDPPTSSVWLFVGKGKAELKDVEAKRHFFKALLAGHETSLITVLGSEIEGKSITRTAKFAGAGTGSGSGSGSASANAGSGSSSGDAAGSAAATAGASGGSGSGSAAAATPPPAKKAVPRRRKRPRRAVVPRVRRTPRRRPRRKKKKKKKKPGLTLPSWAK
ncbi:MAG: hypothetical protein KC503_19605, partial [Myxococcales bacterium]|nr:hypothetical protein [Myxococcales bacterium]